MVSETYLQGELGGRWWVRLNSREGEEVGAS